MTLTPDAVRTVGFIGSGRIGTTLARLYLRTGRQVVLSTLRGPESLRDLVGELAGAARAATPAEAAAAGDVVVVTIPLRGYASVLVEPRASSSSTPTTTTRGATGGSASSTTSRPP